jgi:hypothetical protein
VEKHERKFEKAGFGWIVKGKDGCGVNCCQPAEVKNDHKESDRAVAEARGAPVSRTEKSEARLQQEVWGVETLGLARDYERWLGEEQLQHHHHPK